MYIYDLHLDSHKLGYILISYPVKFSNMSIVDVRLSSVTSSLIHKNIIDMNQLNMLVKLRYLDSFLYLKTPTCFRELMAIKKLNMNAELFNQIREEYKRHYAEHYKHETIVLDLNKYLKGEKVDITYS